MTEVVLPYLNDPKFKILQSMAKLAGVNIGTTWEGASYFNESREGWVYVAKTVYAPSHLYPSKDPFGLTRVRRRLPDLLCFILNNLKLQCFELEEHLEDAVGLTEKDLKRLDKAVTVMKVGFKIMKKVAKQKEKESARLKEVA